MNDEAQTVTEVMPLVARKLKSVRVPEELADLDMSALVRELEQYRIRLQDVRDLEHSGKADAARDLKDMAVAKLGEGVAQLVENAVKN